MVPDDPGVDICRSYAATCIDCCTLNSPEFSRHFQRLSFLPFKLDGRHHPVSDVLSFGIVEHFDLVEHMLSNLGRRFVDPTPYPFTFEQVEKALSNGFFLTVSAVAH
jgi:hypothetical protein